MKKKFALALSGGGFKGAFQVGALDYILSNPILIDGEAVQIKKFDVVSGISVGSLNGAMTACGKFEELKKLWLTDIAKNGRSDFVYQSDFFSKEGMFKAAPLLLRATKLAIPLLKHIFSPRKNLVKRLSKKLLPQAALADNQPLLEKLNEIIVDIGDFGDTIYKTGFVSLIDGKYHSPSARDFDDVKELNKAILASTSIPMMWTPVPSIRSKKATYLQNVDGGVRNNSPLGDVIEQINKDPDDQCEYVIIIVNCNPIELQKTTTDKIDSIEQIALRSVLEITYNEIFNNDIKYFEKINKLVEASGKDSLKIPGIDKQGNPSSRTYRKFKFSTIGPKKSLGSLLDSEKDTILDRYKLGQNAAKKVFPFTPIPVVT